MLAQKPVIPRIPNLNQTNFDASHSQSHADTSQFMLLKADKTQRTPATSKIFPGDSAPNTARTVADAKKDDLKGVEQKHALTKRRNSKDGNIIYDYHGPTNSHIQQILEDLQSRTSGSFMKFCAIKKLQKLSQDFDEFLKKKLPLWMVENKGPLAINSDSIILILLMLGTSTYFALRIENTEVNSGSKYREALQTIHDTGAIFSFVFTLYGLLFLSLSFRWVLSILIVQSTILIFLSLADANIILAKETNHTTSVEGLTIRTTILICGVFWTLAYPVYKVLRRYAGRFTSHLYMSIVCIVIAGATFGLLVLDFMTKDTELEDILQDNAASILVFCGIIVSSSWLIIHFKYFWVPEDSLEVALKHIARKEVKKYTNKSIEKPSMAPQMISRTSDDDRSLVKRLGDQIYWISSLIIGGCYISIEMFLAERILQALKEDNNRSLITAVFFFVAIPLFLIIGISIGLSKGKLKTKSLILPLVIMIPMFGAVPLSNMLGQWSDTVNLAWYLVLGPPAACLFWLLMAFFELKRRRVFYMVLVSSCLFFFLPFVLIGLAESLLFTNEKDSFITVSKYLIISGVAVFGTVIILTIAQFLYRFIKKKIHEMKEHKKFERAEHEKRRSQLQMLELELMQQKDEIKEDGPGGFEECMNLALGKETDKIDPEIGILTSRSDDHSVRFRGEAKDTKRPSEMGDMTSRSRTRKFSKKETKTKRAVWVNLIYVNLKGFGYWINAAAFIVSYTFVVYSLYNIATNATSNERGMLIGVAITMPCIFLINNLLIRMKSTKFTPQERQTYLSKKELETKLFQADLQNDNRILRKSSILEICIIVTGIILIPALQIPLLFVFDSRQNRITNIIIMICSFLVSIFVGGLIELKKRSGPYHKFFVPAFVGLCWLFVIIPFFVAIPLVSIVFVTDDDSFELLVKGSLTGSAFLLMIGVTALAIVINVFFQKLEEEKLIKFIVRYLQTTLKENGVLAGDDVVRRLVEHYIRKVETTGLAALKSELIEENFPIVPIYPPKFVPSGNYGAKLLLYETHNRFLKAMAGGFLKAQLGLVQKKSLLERLAKCCADDHDEFDFNFDLNLDFMGGNDAGLFRVDDYLPEGVAQPQIKWNAMLQEGATPKHSDMSFTSAQQPEPEAEAPKPKISQYDTDYKDAMTPKLALIVLRPLQREDAKVFNRGADAIRLRRDLMEMEMWYQHLFDYLSGRLKVIDENDKSPGLIYKNFVQFLRIGFINLTTEQTDEIFMRNAKVKQQNISYLTYQDFVQAICESANLLFPQKFGEKLLKALTKQIFPHMMRIPDVARNYTMVATGFTKINTPYEPQLDLFDKTNHAQLPSQQEGMLKKDTIQDGPNSGEGSFEISSGNNMNMIMSGTSWTASRHRRSQIRRTSYNQMRRNTGSIMHEAEDEVSIADGQPRTPVARNEKARSTWSPTNAGSGLKNEVKLSKFGNAVAAEEKETNIVDRRRKRRSTFKKVGRNVLFRTAACCEKLGKIYEKVVAKVVSVLTKLGDFVYDNTKGIGRALGFSIEEEHVHTEADDAGAGKSRKDPPEWPVLVDKLLKDIPIAEDLYFLKYYKNGLALMFNLANVAAILNKLEDFYSYSVVAFTPEVPWFSDTKVLETFQSISWELNFINFKTLFWMAIVLVIITVVLSIPSIHYLRIGRLGEDKHGNKAAFPDPQFFLIMIISVLAGSSFCQIMKCLLDAFVCDFDTVPWTLQKDSDIICLSDQHLIYMGVGALAIFAYYPISTFMYPNFQFQDKVLDLKYEPSFLVLSIQAKLVLTGFISFFKSTSATGDTSSVVTKLIGIMILLFLLALITLHLRPCLIKGMNLWEAAGYLASAWVNGSGLVVYITGNSWLGAIMLVSGLIVIFGTTLCVVKQFWKRKPGEKKKKKNKKVSPEQAAEETFVRYDSLKRQAVVPEDVKKMQDMKLKRFSVEDKKDEVRLKVIENPNKARGSMMNQGRESPPAYVF